MVFLCIYFNSIVCSGATWYSGQSPRNHRKLWQFINSQQKVHSDALMQDECYECHSGRCTIHVGTARIDDPVTNDENKENEPLPEPPGADNNTYGMDSTDSVPETELELLCIKANTVEMDIPNSLSNSEVVCSVEPETACDDNDMDGTDSAPETELELHCIKAIQGANSPSKFNVVCHVEHSVDTACDDNGTDSTNSVMVKCDPCVETVCDDNGTDTANSVTVRCEPSVETACDDNCTDGANSVTVKCKPSVEPNVNQEIYNGETDIEKETCDGNASVALSQGRSDGVVEPNTNSQDVSAENTNIQDISAETTNNQDVSDENSSDVSVIFQEYRDQLMIMLQELSELAQNSLHKLSSKQLINSKICDLIKLWSGI